MSFYRSSTHEQNVLACYRKVLSQWPVPHEEQRVDTGQGRTFVVACGDPAAPPLVLLHGSLSNAAAWMFDAALWSRTCRVYAVDMIGEAGLSAPVRPPLASEAYATWLGEVLDGLGLAQTAMVGASLGGWLALDFASRHPARVTRLGLLYPSGIGRQRAFWCKALPMLLLGAWGRRRIRQWVMGTPPAPATAAARDLLGLLELIGRSLKPRLETVPLLGDEALRRLSMPVWLVVGGKDMLLDSADTLRRVHQQVPHAVTRCLPEAPHYVAGQGEALLQFLSAK
ncbi:MAG: putative carboxylesterase nap [Pseudomonas sp.]|nr:MAG: putative carboxylesterase nap [Pseudomonas sp.]